MQRCAQHCYEQQQLLNELLAEEYQKNVDKTNRVIKNPKVSDLKAGDIFNCQGLSGYAVSEYGHTGICISVNSDGTYNTYEQNAEKEQLVAKYKRDASTYTLTSIVRKKK